MFEYYHRVTCIIRHYVSKTIHRPTLAIMDAIMYQKDLRDSSQNRGVWGQGYNVGK